MTPNLGPQVKASALRMTLFAVALALCLGCDREEAVAPIPPEAEEPNLAWADIWAELDTTRAELATIARAALAGREDSAMAALRGRFAASTLPAQFDPYSSYVLRADSLLLGIWLQAGHPNVQLPLDPDWDANPLSDPNWEFQMHSWLTPACLLYAFADSGDPAYLDYYLFLLADWMEENFESEASSAYAWYDHAVANRTAGWLAALPVVAAQPACSDSLFARWLRCLFGSLDWLASEENYNALSNHGLFMNLALIEGCARLEDFNLAVGLATLAIYRTEAQLFVTTTPLGVNREQTPYYHTRVWNLYRDFQPVLEASGLAFSTPFHATLERMGNFHAYLLRPDLDYPMFGDGQRRFNPQLLLPNSDAEIEYVVNQGLSGQKPVDRYRLYPESGYIFLRSGWGEERPYAEEVQMVLDFGPHGTTSHGHHDHGSFEICAYGESWFVDSGYYAVAGPERLIFTAPRAHNVLTLPETNTFPHDEEIVRWFTSERGAMSEARLALGGVLQDYRSVVYLPPSSFLVIDRVPGICYHPLELIFHFHPDREVTLDGNGVRASGEHAQLVLQQLLDTPDPDIVMGAEDQGWYSEIYGEREPNAALVYTAPTVATDNAWVTWIDIAESPAEPSRAELLEFAFADSLRISITAASGSRELLIVFGPQGYFKLSP